MSSTGLSTGTHVRGDPACVRVAGSWCYACLLVDPRNREAVGHSAGRRRGAGLVKAAFATPGLPISDIEASRTDRGSEPDDAEIDLMLEAFGVERPLSAKGCPHDDAVDEPADKMLKTKFVYRERFSDLRDLQIKLSDYVHRHDDFRIRSTLGYMSPVEFRRAGMTLSKPSK
ncbi:IS3 family transposase [Enorma phocaeensis]|uniref:IS3 family transposase n=1 Tax=Enorma phocaeensis TaxID=1871019 RepID=A0A921IVX4_9ACTN|nr:IS3 family transposase [Enorma phocaeensis]HJG37169.1 IS3 family transposase [Enorma phocaeensis]